MRWLYAGIIIVIFVRIGMRPTESGVPVVPAIAQTVVEEAQVLDLVDGEHQGGAVDRPHQPAERLDDLKSAPLAGVGVERCHRLLRQVAQLVPVEVLAHALVDARV